MQLERVYSLPDKDEMSLDFTSFSFNSWLNMRQGNVSVNDSALQLGLVELYTELLL